MGNPDAARLAHAVDRLRERYSARATLEDALAAERAIQAGEAMRLTSEPRGAARYLVRIRPGLAAVALYHEDEGRLVFRGERRVGREG